MNENNHETVFLDLVERYKQAVKEYDETFSIESNKPQKWLIEKREAAHKKLNALYTMIEKMPSIEYYDKIKELEQRIYSIKAINKIRWKKIEALEKIINKARGILMLEKGLPKSDNEDPRTKLIWQAVTKLGKVKLINTPEIYQDKPFLRAYQIVLNLVLKEGKTTEEAISEVKKRYVEWFTQNPHKLQQFKYLARQSFENDEQLREEDHYKGWPKKGMNEEQPERTGNGPYKYWEHWNDGMYSHIRPKIGNVGDWLKFYLGKPEEK